MENMRLEISSRPTVKQWTHKLNEIKELESKLHDFVVMRHDSAELEVIV